MEVVGDLVAVRVPVPWRILTKEVELLSTKIPDRGVVFLVSDVPVRQAP